MVDTPIVDLPALAEALATGDFFEMVNVSDTTDSPEGSSVKVTPAQVQTLIGFSDGQLSIEIDGQGSAITTGTYGFWRIPFNCTIDSNDLVADQSGSIVIDVWVDSYANFPPTNLDSITASAPPTLSSAIKSQDVTLTGWTKTLTKGEYLAVNVDSITTVTKITLTLPVTKT